MLFGCAIARELRGGAFAQTLDGLRRSSSRPGSSASRTGSRQSFSRRLTWTRFDLLHDSSRQNARSRLYIPIALVVTLGLYAKYSIAACAVALAIGMLADGTRRTYCARAWLAFRRRARRRCSCCPMRSGRSRHGLPMLEVLHNDQLNRHALANGMADESPDRWTNALYMLGLQFAYQNPLFAPVWIWGLLWFWKNRPYRYLRWPICLLFGIAHHDDRTRLLHPRRLSGALCSGRRCDRKRHQRRAARAKIAVVAAVIRRRLPMFPLSLPILPLPAYMAYERAIGLSRPAPPDGKRHLINPMFADQLGWKTMTQTVAGAYWSLPPRSARSRRSSPTVTRTRARSIITVRVTACRR